MLRPRLAGKKNAGWAGVFVCAWIYFLRLRPAKRLLKRSTRPPVSTIFCFPVKKGWHWLHTSREMSSQSVERVLISLPQLQRAVISSYFGWISAFMTILDTPQIKFGGKIPLTNQVANQNIISNAIQNQLTQFNSIELGLINFNMFIKSNWNLIKFTSNYMELRELA